MGSLKTAALAVAAAMICLPAMADFSKLKGSWTPAGQTCNSDADFTIHDGYIQFHESGCDFSAPPQATGVGNAYFLRMSCSGEGESWNETAIFAATEQGGLIAYYSNSFGFLTKSCSR